MPAPSPKMVQRIAQACLCLRVQRASRVIGRRFDEAFRSLGLNNWQFSLLMAINQPIAPTVNEVAEVLAMDRTTTTRNVKVLQGRRLVEVRRDDKDARVRRIVLTDAGRARLAEAVQHWQTANDSVAAHLKGSELACLHAALKKIATS
jgi:DNA-binding MarR family transcriptional regulator